MAALATIGLKQDFRSIDLCRKKHYNVDFSGQDLSKLKLRQSVFFCCNFDGADLTEADCEGSDFCSSTFRRTICYRTNFKDAKLSNTLFDPKDCFGMTVTLQCKTFEGMQPSQIWWYGFLFFLTMMRPLPGPVKEPLVDNLIAMIGAERYVNLKAMFQKRDL
jgi:Pentapeptide repeats (8 copies)